MLHQSMEAWREAKGQRLTTELTAKFESEQDMRAEIAQIGDEIQKYEEEIEKKLKEKRRPVLLNGRELAQKNACFANLKQIQGAIQVWALENNASAQDKVTLEDISGSGDVSKPISKAINHEIMCPGGGTYSVSDISSAPTCTVPGHALH